MKTIFTPKSLIISCFLFFSISLFAGNPFSTHFGFHFGLTSGGMKPFDAAGNPLVFNSRKDQLKVGWGRSIGFSVEKIKWKNDGSEAKPSWGMRLGLLWNNIDQEFEKEILDGYHFKYFRIPVEALICIYSKKAYIRDDDEIIISGDRITFHKGAGVIATRSSVFLTAGLSYAKLNQMSFEDNHTFGPNYNDTFAQHRGNISDKDHAFHVGIEFRHANIGLHVNYQESLSTIYKGKEIKMGMVGVLIKLIF